MKIKMIAVCWIVCAAVACSKQDRDEGRSEPAPSPAEFTQDFYDWYVSLALADMHGPASDSALAARPYIFARKLLAALEEDSKAQAAAAGSGMIDGLDFDPFLNAQDPCDRYVVGQATAHGTNWLVDVRGEGGCAAHETPDVVAELARRDTSWVFVDFRYPDSDDDLLTVLARLHPEGATASPEASLQGTSLEDSTLDAKIERLARAQGSFSYARSGVLMYSGDDAIFRAFEGDSAVARLAECIGRSDPSLSTYNGQAVAVGFMCFVALTRTAYATRYEDSDDAADWPGLLEPDATAEQLEAARKAWEEVVKAGAYRLARGRQDVRTAILA